jgi:Molecular chaperone
MSARALGLDFGTTNTVLAFANAGAQAQPVMFQHHAATLSAFRSALCFWDEGDENAPHVMAEAGPWAIDHFMQAAANAASSSR